MRKRLKTVLLQMIPNKDLLYVSNSYDIIGDIAIVHLSGRLDKCSGRIAEAIMQMHKNVRTVLSQSGPVHGSFRTRTLEHLAGDRKTVTTHVEHGCSFLVDVEKCYFSPRLSNERMRIAEQVRTGEIVVNMFAGVGCFFIINRQTLGSMQRLFDRC